MDLIQWIQNRVQRRAIVNAIIIFGLHNGGEFLEQLSSFFQEMLHLSEIVNKQ